MTEEQIEESRLRARDRYEAFLAETARLDRQNRYWEYRARNDLKIICFLYECSDCGKLVGAKHALKCPEAKELTPIMPSEMSLSERLQRCDDPFNDQTWDYDPDVHKLAEIMNKGQL